MYEVFKVSHPSLNPHYLSWLLQCEYFQEQIKAFSFGTVRNTLNFEDFQRIKIPLPSLEEQERIVKELNSYQKIIDGAKEIIYNWQPRFEVKDDWKKQSLNTLLDYEQPNKYIVSDTFYHNSNKIPVLTAGKGFVLGYTNENSNIFNASKEKAVIIFDDFTTSIQYVNFPFKVKSSAMKILINRNNKISLIDYIYIIMKQIIFDSTIHKRYWISEYSNIEIPLPPLKKQQSIVNQLEKERAMIEQLKELIKMFEKKIDDKLSSLWSQKKQSRVRS